MSTTADRADAVGCVPAWENEHDPAWLALSARFRGLVASTADRTDLVVKVRPTIRDTASTGHAAGDNAPIACFVSTLAEVRFNATRIWNPQTDDPDTIDPLDSQDRDRHPHMVGAACHEAAHAAHTRLNTPTGVDSATAHWTVMLEEPRIEARLVSRRPQDRTWLRAAAVTLCADGSLTVDGGGRYGAARAAVLFLGRVAAGVLTAAETETLRADVEATLGADTLDEVEDVLATAVNVADGDTETLLTLGQRMAAVVAEEPPDNPADDTSSPGSAGNSGCGQPGEDGDGDGSESTSDGDGNAAGEQGGDDTTEGAASGDESAETPDEDGPTEGAARQLPCGSWTPGDLPDGTDPWGSQPDPATEPEMGEVIRQTAADVAADARDKVAAKTRTPVPRPHASSPIEQHAHNRAQQAASHVFGAGTEKRPIVVVDQPPSAGDHEQTRRLTMALRRAQFRGIARSTVPAAAPPGRMRMGEVMRREAQKAARARVTAQPWRQTRRREVEQPPLTVGFSGDVSASMGKWQSVTARASWAVAQAVANLRGTVAATAWNQDTARTIRPGEAPEHVPEASCGGGSGGCALSLRALDGALGLTTSDRGARAVVVVTDGNLHNRAEVNTEVSRLARHGVRVLWVTDRPDPAQETGVANIVLDDPAEFGERIGQALADLLAQT